MQKAEVVLSMLSQKSAQNSEYMFDRLYRNLFNPDFYLLAYSNIYAREGHMTEGVDEETINGFNTTKVAKTIAQLKQETYYPNPVRGNSVPKKDGMLQAPGSPSLQDQLVQEIIQLLLQAIYEPVFKDSSHGFRPGKSCHTALVQLKTTCKGTNWVIEGDIKGFFDGKHTHARLLEILSHRISDGRLLHLIDKFLNAGYMEFRPTHTSLTGTPQGAIVSPILANIYLHELDTFMEQTCNQLNAQKGTRQKDRPYQELNLERLYARNNEANSREYVQAETLLNTMRTTHPHDPFDPHAIQVKYIRYADDFVIMIVGSKGLAEQIRAQVRVFLEQELQLNPEKLLITNLLDQRIRFLDYEIARTKAHAGLAEHSPRGKGQAVNETIQLLVPGDVIQEKLTPFVKNGKATHHNARINLPLLDLLTRYNAEISSLYNYYSLATDVSTKVGKYRYYHYYSLLKTVARKEKCSIAQVLSKYGIDVKLKQKTGTRKLFGVSYETNAGPQTLTYFNDVLRKKELCHAANQIRQSKQPVGEAVEGLE